MKTVLKLGIMLVMALIIVACSNSNEELLGKWEEKSLGLVIYEFKKDGTVIVDDLEGNKIEGKYSVKDDKLTFEMDGEKQEFSYQLKEEDLILTVDSEEYVFSKMKKDSKTETASAEPVDDSKEEEEVVEETQYLHNPIEIKKNEEVIFENEFGKISMIGQGVEEIPNDDDEGQTNIETTIAAVKVEGDLVDSFKNTELIMNGIFEGGGQDSFDSLFSYKDGDSNILVYNSETVGNLQRLDVAVVKSDLSGDEKAEVEPKKIVFNQDEKEMVTIGKIKKLPDYNQSLDIALKDEEKEVKLTNVDYIGGTLRVSGEVTYLNDDIELSENEAALNIPYSGENYNAELNGEFFAGIASQFTVEFEFDEALQEEENNIELYLFGLGTKLNISEEGKENDNNEKPLNQHSIFSDDSGFTYYPSVNGIVDTTGKTTVKNTIMYEPTWHGTDDEEDPNYNGDLTIPLGQQFKEFNALLSIEKATLNEEDLVEGTLRDVVVEFYETKSFPTSFDNPPQNEGELLETVTLKNGEAPKEVSLDVSGMSGIYVLFKGPRGHSGIFEDSNLVDKYNLIVKDATLTYDK